MTAEQYDCLVKLMRGNPETAANQAARLVLVECLSQADAMRATGTSRTTVSISVKRYLEAFELASNAFGKAAL